MIRALVLFSLLAPAVPNVAIGPDVESTAKPVDAPIKTVIVFGATGFTGGLTAEYLARNAPAQDLG